MRRFFNSLTFKIGTIIILVEIIILAVTGFIYIERFSDEIDERVKTRIQVPRTLTESGLLDLGAVADEQLMRDLVGEELVDGMILTMNGRVIFSINPAYRQQEFTSLPGIDPRWFEVGRTKPLLEETPDGWISIAPTNELFVIYIKVGTSQANSEKRAIVGQFVLGSIATVVATSVVIILLFYSTILTRIKALLGVLERVELGDLTAKVDGSLSSDEVGVLQRGVNSMVGRLAEMVGTLEERVIERSHALELSAEISRRLSTILDQEQLVAEVVEQVRSAFDYYYAQIYLFDETGANLVLTSGTGKAGRTMLERKHSLPNGRGLVGRAAKRNTHALVRDVFRGIGVEIVTSDNVDQVYQRETDREFEARWYADWLATFFGEVETARQLARQQSAIDKVIQIGYVLQGGASAFTDVIQRGAEAAAQDLGVELEIAVPTSPDARPNEHLPLFEALILKRKDGLVVVPGGEEWLAAMQRATQAGIPVVAANVESPLMGITNVVQDNFQSGSILASEVIKLLVAERKEQGQIIVGPSNSDRIEGFRHGIRNTNYTLIQVDTPEEFTDRAARIYWRKAIDDYPDFIAAVGLLSVDIPVLAELKRDSGGKWLIVGYDLNIETLEAIRAGAAQLTIGQHPYLQGYLPILALVEHLRRGQPLEGWIAEGWLPNPLLPETKAEVAVPIASGEEVFGVLDVQHRIAGGLTPEAVNLLQSIADQVAIGLQNARLVANLEDALAEIRAIHGRYLEKSWGKSRISTRRGQYHYTRSNVPALPESTLIEAKRRALTQEHPATIILNGDEGAEESQSKPTKSIVAPITLRDKAIGALHLHPANDGQEWTEDDLALVEAVADQLAQTAESLRLFEETRQRAGREQVIRGITDKLRQAPTLEALTRTASEELSRILGVSHSLVRVGTKATPPLAGNETSSPEKEITK